MTILEIMIVIFIIGIICSLIGYNMKGTLDKGKVFRTEQAIEQLKDLLLMCLAEGESAEKILKNPTKVLEKYGLAKNPEKIMEDGWGKKFDITFDRKKNDFKIASLNLDSYRKKTMKTSVQDDWVDEE